jgi:hypothetical protein
VTTVLRGVSIEATQPAYVILASKDTGDDNLMQGHTLHLKTVKEATPYILEEDRRTGDEIGNAPLEVVHIEIGIAADVNKLRLPPLCLSPVLNRAHAPLLSRHILHLL